MTTTLFAIFAIALVATLAWVITRIVNIFVELEGLHQQAKDLSERMDNPCLEISKLKVEVESLKKAHALIKERMRVEDELQGILKERQNLLEDRMKSYEGLVLGLRSILERIEKSIK